MRQTVRRFLAKQAPLSYVRAQLDDPKGITDAVWQGLTDLGAVSLLVPEPLGGGGLSMIEMGVVHEEAGRALLPGPLLSSSVGATGLLLELEPSADRDELLSALASGRTVATVALFEPGQRYSWRAPETVATAAGLITGTKVAVADGDAAHVFLVVAAPADHSSLRVYAVDRRAPGVQVDPVASSDGTRKAAQVTFSDAPAIALSAGGDAAAAVAAAIDRLVVALVADGVGAADQAMALAVDYAKDRHQFDRPIGSFQAVQHLCADMLQAIELTRAGAYYAMWAASSADPTERHRAATMAKAFASQWLPKVGASVIQVCGGIGFTWEHDAHLYYKRLLTLEQYLGGPADHLEELAHLILDHERPPAAVTVDG
jgi:alkylation response protein AidB-like acyl-CoA dehydrogenase